MSSGSLEPPSSTYAMRPGRGSLVLHETGFRHPRSMLLRNEAFTAYADVTHLQLGTRRLRIGTRQGVFWLRRGDFAEPQDVEAFVRALLERIVREPGGSAQLARMAQVEEAARSARPPRATLALVLICLVVHGLQLALGPIVAHAGHFSAELVTHGEGWRLITGNLLHGLPGDGGLGWLHLALNLLGLLGVGAMVELPLGALRTVFVLGLSALGAMGAGWLADYHYAVGASGVVAGLAGGAAWLEFRLPEGLPAGWRVPRRLFVGVLIANALLPLLLPVIAGAAHLGGFAAGAAGAALCAGPRLARAPVRPSLALADALLAGFVAASLAGAAPLVAERPGALARHAGRVLALSDAPPLLLNNAAWLIAVAREAPPEALTRARSIAERAVEATGRADAGVLDTLAEAQFRSGDPESALETIEEAIALAPDEPYYREQRRRFRGERDFDDRPSPPEAPPLPPPPATPWPQEPGVRV